ncbi:MAG: hypothetical protein PHU36_07425 [Syntrophomonadaceae bacterium]|nr:hypothetical protein [Syntrophomonadaceae bacterium]
MTDKQKMINAFEQLRREGFFAEMNYKDCQTCALSALPKNAENVVFYTEQNEKNSFDEDIPFIWRPLHLKWKGNAQRIVDVLNLNGLIATWSGKQEEAIIVKGKHTMGY